LNLFNVKIASVINFMHMDDMILDDTVGRLVSDILCVVIIKMLLYNNLYHLICFLQIIGL